MSLSDVVDHRHDSNTDGRASGDAHARGDGDADGDATADWNTDATAHAGTDTRTDAASLPPGLLFFAGGAFVLGTVAAAWYLGQ